jgi:ribosome maturation factor RimP
MSRNPLLQRLITIIEPVCKQSGYDLVDLRFVLEQIGWVLRVCVDLPLDEHTDPTQVPEDRVDLTDCENLSRELSAVLDVDDPITQAYSLEVGSPGIDRPLRVASHFVHFTGSDAKIQLAVPLAITSPNGTPGERRNFRGILRGVTDDKVAIECDGQVFHLPIADIDQAKLVPDWDAVMKGKSGVGAPSAKPIKPGHRPSQKKQKSKHSAPDEQTDASTRTSLAPHAPGGSKEQG